MRQYYWQPLRASSIGLVLMALFAAVGLGSVEAFRTQPEQTFVSEKLAAATLARQAMEAIKEERLACNVPIDPSTDPTGSGLIGHLGSPVTSNNGHLPAKQTSVNPNFAAVMRQLLKDAGLKPGDTVAVGFSGSFPALNLCTVSALETAGLKPVIISSASASQWGANDPQLLWIDMERTLVEQGIFKSRSVAASLGGIDDRAVGMSDQGRQLLEQALVRNELPRIEGQDYLDSVNQRMTIYRQQAGKESVRAYINVGGGTTSVGTKKGKKLFAPGLNARAPLGQLPVDSVMARFSASGVPVIHLVQVESLATRYGLPVQPAALPRVGEGRVYSPHEYNLWLAGGVLLVVVVGVYFVARSQPLVDPQSLKRVERKPQRMPEPEEELATL